MTLQNKINQRYFVGIKIAKKIPGRRGLLEDMIHCDANGWKASASYPGLFCGTISYDAVVTRLAKAIKVSWATPRIAMQKAIKQDVLR